MSWPSRTAPTDRNHGHPCGNAGKALSDASFGLSASEIADAVWGEALSGHATSGTTGKALSDAAVTFIYTLTVTTAGREQNLSSFTDLLRVTRVWWPYESNGPSWALPNWVPFE